MDFSSIMTTAGSVLIAAHLLIVFLVFVSTKFIKGDEPEATLQKVDEVLQNFIQWITERSKK